MGHVVQLSVVAPFAIRNPDTTTSHNTQFAVYQAVYKGIGHELDILAHDVGICHYWYHLPRDRMTKICLAVSASVVQHTHQLAPVRRPVIMASYLRWSFASSLAIPPLWTIRNHISIAGFLMPSRTMLLSSAAGRLKCGLAKASRKDGI